MHGAKDLLKPRWQGIDLDPRVREQIIASLSYHGIPQFLEKEILSRVPCTVDDSLVETFAGLFEEVFEFENINFSMLAPAQLMLVGTPGVGKSVMVAKLIARALETGKRPLVATLDCFKAGAVQQLVTYGEALGVQVEVCRDFSEFRQFLALRTSDETCMIIDTPGIDPRSEEDIALLAQYVYLWGLPPVLCLPGGLDVITAQDRSLGFAKFGADRLIITQVDLVDRLGGVLVAAHTGRYALAAMNQSPYIGRPFTTLRPRSLAKCLLAKAGLLS